MAELRELCESIHLKDAETYIQSGNIVFKSAVHNTSKLEELLSKAILKQFGFQIPVLIKTIDQVAEVLHGNPFATSDETIRKQLYFVLIAHLPNTEMLNTFKTESFENEEFSVSDNCIYLKCTIGYGKAKLNNNLIERKLKVLATTRNYRTLNKLLEMGS